MVPDRVPGPRCAHISSYWEMRRRQIASQDAVDVSCGHGVGEYGSHPSVTLGFAPERAVMSGYSRLGRHLAAGPPHQVVRKGTSFWLMQTGDPGICHK